MCDQDSHLWRQEARSHNQEPRLCCQIVGFGRQRHRLRCQGPRLFSQMPHLSRQRLCLCGQDARGGRPKRRGSERKGDCLGEPQNEIDP